MSNILIIENILIVAHDAGGAEIVSSYVRQNPSNGYQYLLDGPAVNIFQKKLGNIKINQTHDESFVKGFDSIITGQSWASDLEKKIIQAAKRAGIKVVTFVDHWVGYTEGFKYQDKITLPNEIWLGDVEALEIAKKEFPNDILRLIENPYFIDINKSLNEYKVKKTRISKTRILYVCEPLMEHSIKEYGHSMHFGYTEYDAMDFFFSHISNLCKIERLDSIRVRKHPSEGNEKYNDLLMKHRTKFCIEKSNNVSLLEDCAWADIVVGCESMAMVIGLMAGKRVFSTIPPGGKDCRLPQKEISHIKYFE
jgi:hypothetical protein